MTEEENSKWPTDKQFYGVHSVIGQEKTYAEIVKSTIVTKYKSIEDLVIERKVVVDKLNNIQQNMDKIKELHRCRAKIYNKNKGKKSPDVFNKSDFNKLQDIKVELAGLLDFSDLYDQRAFYTKEWARLKRKLHQLKEESDEAELLHYVNNKLYAAQNERQDEEEFIYLPTRIEELFFKVLPNGVKTDLPASISELRLLQSCLMGEMKKKISDASVHPNIEFHFSNEIEKNLW